MSIDLSCQLLCACEAAYCVAPDAPNGKYNPCNGNPKVTADMKKQYDAVGFLEDPYIVTSAQIEAAVVGQTTQGIIVALRGTLAPAKNIDSILDWMQDLMLEPMSNINLPGKVHSGFLLAVTLLAPGIKEAIEKIQAASSGPLDIYVTGHSKGGGMAPIMTQYLKNVYGIKATQAIFFAGPNPGDTDFCNAFNTEFPNTLRYQNYLDIVPLLPATPMVIDTIETILGSILPQKIKNLLDDAKSWNYSYVGTMMYIDESRDPAKKESSLEADLIIAEDWASIGKHLLTGNFADVANAHHSACGYGYMDGTCGTSVCGS